MDNDLDLVALLTAMKVRAGSVERLAELMGGVTSRTIRDWLKKDATGLANIQPDKRRRILETARSIGIPVEVRAEQRLWDPARSYEDNLGARIGLPAGTRLPLRSLDRLVLGRHVGSPFGPSSSVITADSERVRFLAQSGNSVLTYKTVRSRETRAHLHPNLFYCSGEVEAPDPEVAPLTYLVDMVRGRTLAVVNRFGMPSQAPEIWKTDFRRAAAYLDESSQILILSVTGTARRGDPDDLLIEDFARVVGQARDAAANFIELNLSCPNCSGPEGRVFEKIELTRRICDAAFGAAGGVPLIAKIGYLPPAELDRLVGVIAPFASGIAAMNTLSVRALRQGLDGTEAAFGDADLLVGLSGQPLLALGLQTIERLSRIREHKGLHGLALLGMGGVTSPLDVQRYLDSGADVVQAASVFLIDPLFGEKVHQFLEDREAVSEDPDRRLVRDARNNWTQAFDRLETENPTRGQAVAQAAVAVWMEWKNRTSSDGPWSGPKRMHAPDVLDFSRRIAHKAGVPFRHR
jgi:dihydroorotate dehydrogenase (NAD+) catalytic subunit